jgi:hypothetical protein
MSFCYISMHSMKYYLMIVFHMDFKNCSLYPFYCDIICLIYTILVSGKHLLLYRVHRVRENSFSQDPNTIKRLIDIYSYKNTRILW